ncbi:hypothetical protein HJD18_10295 [Thermoleophilia bacterium SCSIO 60948]|nr:hypothetical protein HJD18_10295 [Thermoleophilia bacterium SCSIO 60948]
MAVARTRTRMRELDPIVFDVAVAALFAIVGVLDILVLADPTSPDPDPLLGIVLTLTLCAGLAFRRRAPWAMIVLVFGSLVLLEVGARYLDGLSVAFVGMLWCFYSLGRWAEPLIPLAVASIAGGFGALIASVGLTQTLAGGFLFVAPLGVGYAVRARVDLNARLRAAVARIEQSRRTEAENAVGEERERIAGELQAVVANGVSVVVAQAEAVPRLLGSGDAAAASRSLAVIEETGRDALAEMRRLLGVLRRDGESAERRPLPSLGDLRQLVERTAASGLIARVEVEGARPELSSGVELAAYRLIERGLEAAAEAGATNAEVRLTYGERDVGVEVTDDRPREAPHSDYAAIRERVRIYDGSVRVGSGGIGFALRARLPTEVGT